MTTPINSPLLPVLNGRQLSVDVALKQPTIIAQQIAKLADDMILLPKLFRQYGSRVQAGAMLWNSIASSDYYTAGPVEPRVPGAEYKQIEGVLPDPRLSLVEDFGGAFTVPIEQVLRNNISLLDTQVLQLANTITKTLDLRAVAALEAEDPASIAVSTPWDTAITVGPLDQLTASNELPTAHFAAAQELADRDELGVKLDTLLVAPEQARALRTLYGQYLDQVLKSAGLTMHSNPRLTDGTAYMVQGGMVGVVGWEFGLTTESWIDQSIRSWRVQSFAVPAFAVDRPFACKKLTGLSS
ncbi:major capsid protein [Mycobacterium senriense]|uniref:Major capsid protein n=1 Tax=Mycobacterium senriense TaxID=2775496 RepID=A0ABM7T2F5_9MYCO|nr:hypothetical protein MTY59_47090 [Mycobacterium senriense]